MEMKRSGLTIVFTPPAIAWSHSPVWIARTARCSATSELEHAVSMDALGPIRLSAYDTRLATQKCGAAPNPSVTPFALSSPA